MDISLSRLKSVILASNFREGRGIDARSTPIPLVQITRTVAPSYADLESLFALTEPVLDTKTGLTYEKSEALAKGIDFVPNKALKDAIDARDASAIRPEPLECPITLSAFQKPVQVVSLVRDRKPDGTLGAPRHDDHVYEEAPLRHWLSTHDTSVIDRAEYLFPLRAVPNHAVANICRVAAGLPSLSSEQLLLGGQDQQIRITTSGAFIKKLRLRIAPAEAAGVAFGFILLIGVLGGTLAGITQAAGGVPDYCPDRIGPGDGLTDAQEKACHTAFTQTNRGIINNIGITAGIGSGAGLALGGVTAFVIHRILTASYARYLAATSAANETESA